MSRFHRSLSRCHRCWRAGQLVCALMVITAGATLGILLHGWADYKLALSSGTREAVNTGLAVAAGLAMVIWLYRIARTRREEVAAMVDERRADPRRRILAASSLENQEAETDMQRFHLDRALEDAALELDEVPTKHRMPFKAIGQAFDATPLESDQTPELVDGRIKVDEFQHTSLPGVWAGGDCTAGKDLTVTAVQDGKIAALSINEYLNHG